MHELQSTDTHAGKQVCAGPEDIQKFLQQIAHTFWWQEKRSLNLDFTLICQMCLCYLQMDSLHTMDKLDFCCNHSII